MQPFDRQPKIDAVNNFVAILRLMKNPKALLPDLLHLICERFSAKPKYITERNAGAIGFIQMKCSSHSEPHSIFPFSSHSLGFLLVEQVEEFFGTTEQRLDSITGGTFGGDLFTAVTSRMMRQQMPLTLFSPREIYIDNMRSAEAFNALWVNSGNRGNLKCLKVNNHFELIFYRKIFISFFSDAKLPKVYD